MDKKTTDCATILNEIEQCAINSKRFIIPSIEQINLVKKCIDENNLTGNKKFKFMSTNGNNSNDSSSSRSRGYYDTKDGGHYCGSWDSYHYDTRHSGYY